MKDELRELKKQKVESEQKILSLSSGAEKELALQEQRCEYALVQAREWKEKYEQLSGDYAFLQGELE